MTDLHHFQFGDIIENGWASGDNPTKRGVFIQYKHRSGRLNPGKQAVIRFDSGNLGEFRIDMEARLTKVGTIFDADRAKIAVMKQALIPFADVADFMDSETSGFSPEDKLSLDFMADGEEVTFVVNEFLLQQFYDARAAVLEAGR